MNGKAQPRSSPRFQSEEYRKTYKKNLKIINEVHELLSPKKRRNKEYPINPRKSELDPVKLAYIQEYYGYLDELEDGMLDITAEEEKRMRSDLSSMTHLDYQCPHVLRFQQGSKKRWIRGVVLGPGTVLVSDDNNDSEACLRIYFPTQDEQYRYTCRKLKLLMAQKMVTELSGLATAYELNKAHRFIIRNMKTLGREPTTPVRGTTTTPVMAKEVDDSTIASTSLPSTPEAIRIDDLYQEEMNDRISDCTRIRYSTSHGSYQFLVEWRPTRNKDGSENFYEATYFDEGHKVMDAVREAPRLAKKMMVMKEHYDHGDRDDILSWRASWNRYLVDEAPEIDLTKDSPCSGIN